MSNIGPQDIEGAASAVLGIWTQMLWENVGNDGIHMDLCLIDIIERGSYMAAISKVDPPGLCNLCWFVSLEERHRLVTPVLWASLLTGHIRIDYT